jgi:hypothetical protein
MASKTKRSPVAAYAEQRAALDILLAEIQQGLEAHAASTKDKPHWGHVGDLAGYRERLQSVADSMLKRGEYAPDEPFCACGRRESECDGSRRACRKGGR